MNTAAIATKAVEVEFNVGDTTTCQFGNPSDTNWEEATHANVPVKVVLKKACDITKRMYYLVVKLDNNEYLGRAAVSRAPRNEEDDAIAGVLYCTSARTIGSKAQKWTGIMTFVEAASSLGFDVL